MTYTIKVGKYYCYADITINGKEAFPQDFGYQEDKDWENALPYCCANMQFTPYEPKKEVCEKYGITEEEFTEIAEELAKKLSWGCCCLCE